MRSNLPRILIVEDQMKDLRIAEQTARSAGFSDLEARTNIHSAKVYLEKAVSAEENLPDLILLDLDLGQESGYELLRIRYDSPPWRRLWSSSGLIWDLIIMRYARCSISMAMSQSGKALPLYTRC
jgi:CheY-like chemotaxis protein